MDAQRFDDLVRTLLRASSRRGVLARVARGLLAPLAPALLSEAAEARKKRKKKHKKRKKAPQCTPACADKACGPDGCGGSCGSCEEDHVCQNGACVNDCSGDCIGKECGDDGCGGSCGSCGSCATCQGNSCIPKADDTTCDGDGKCLSGSCNPLPTCVGWSANDCPADPASCCGQTFPCDGAGQQICGPSRAGESCLQNGDCWNNDCLAYRCRRGGPGAPCLGNEDCLSNSCRTGIPPFSCN